MKNARARTLTAISAAALALVLVACGGSTTPTNTPTGAGGGEPSDGNPSEELIAAAKAEGTLTWYTTVPPAPNAALVEAFATAGTAA